MKSTKRVFVSAMCAMLILSSVSCSKSGEKDTDAFAQQTESTSQTQITAGESNQADFTTTKGTTTTRKTTTTSVTTTASTSTTSGTTASTMPPQVITTTQNASGQLTFSTSGILRDNAEFDALMNDLNNIMYPYRDTVSFTYENIENGICISYNGDTRYNSCSTIKAPYCKMLLSSGVDLSQEIEMKSSMINSYSGRIDGKPIGTKFTVEYLIWRTIIYSDNTAYNMLFQTFGWTAFNDMTTSLGLTTFLSSGLNYRKVSSNEMRTYFKDIYSFCQTSSGKYLRSLLTSCDYNLQIGYALPQYEVAQKYGCQTSTSDLHDCAIVYADSPFILTIMSDLNPDSAQSLAIFRQLAVIFDQINTQQTEPEQTTATTTAASAKTSTAKPTTSTAKPTTTTPKTTTTVPKTTTNATTVTNVPATTITTITTTTTVVIDYSQTHAQTTSTYDS